MSTTEPKPEEARELAEELHQLEADEAALERRTRSLELAGPLALALSVVALALGGIALIVALANDNGSTSGGMMNRAGAGSMMGSSGQSAGTMMAGVGAHGRFTPEQMAAAAKGTVYVQLGEYWAAPTVGSIRAGKVTFIARNVGQVPHELMVERMPMKFDAPMHPNEDAAQGMIDDMEPGQGGRMTIRLSPGTYMLFCNAPGHYAAGQHIMFRATA